MFVGVGCSLYILSSLIRAKEKKTHDWLSLQNLHLCFLLGQKEYISSYIGSKNLRHVLHSLDSANFQETYRFHLFGYDFLHQLQI